jgi:hypothetical protein
LSKKFTALEDLTILNECVYVTERERVKKKNLPAVPMNFEQRTLNVPGITQYLGVPDCQVLNWPSEITITFVFRKAT